MTAPRGTARPEPATVEGIGRQIWRITTAARVFVLATATGQLLATGGDEALWTLVALGVVAAACCVAELPLAATPTLFVPFAEGLAVVSVLALGPGPADAIAVYLVLPGLVAGVRLGSRAATATTLAVVAGAVMVDLVRAAAGGTGPVSFASVPWAVAGLGAGLLAASLTRAMRSLASSQTPYASAQRLLAQWDSLLAQENLTLDIALLCRDLQEAACSATGGARSAVWIHDSAGGATPLAMDGAAGLCDEAVVIECLDSGAAGTRDHLVALPLRSGETIFGAVSVELDQVPEPAVLARAQARIDEHAFRLQTGLVLDGVRCRATTEERRRLARDLHDGVAQRLAAVAHLSDEIAAETPDADVAALADHLHEEVVGIVAELRSSVLDLREDEPGGLSAALSTYVRELSRRSPMRVHLSLDERGERLPRRTEAEVVRIAREAIGNVDKHARAANLWVTLATDASGLRLTVADDGVGHARPRDNHFGLHTMRERAELVGAQLSITERPDGGTVVALDIQTTPTTKESPDDDHRLARR